MFTVFRNAWKIADLRKKILYTAFIVVIFRIGSAIPVPFLDPSVIKGLVEQSGSILGYMDVITGGALGSATIFAMSVTPYINASIIINLLTVAIPKLEQLAREGEEGRRAIAKITRWMTVGFAAVLATGYYFLLRSQKAVLYQEGWESYFVAFIIILTFTAGSVLIMWLGEQINEKGVGNGISIIIFAGIVSQGPKLITSMKNYLDLAASGGGNEKYYIYVPIALIIALLMIGFIVIMTKGERKIPVQYAKRVVGRKMYGGQSSFIPIKVNMSGVMPVIFAGSLLSIPGIIASFINPEPGSIWDSLLSIFNYDSITYGAIYFLLILLFNFFYVSISVNPLQMANDLRKNNGMIPGIRAGKPTSEFLSRVVNKITLVGAVFLGFIAIFPILYSSLSGMQGLALGGTSVIILVGVALETSTTLESLMTMRHHKGFLE